MPPIDPIDAAAVRSRVDSTAWPDLVIHRSVGSTNAELLELARAGARPGTVVATTDQTAGRGRRTRVWTTPPGVSLALSMLLRPSVPLANWSWIPLLAGVVIRRAITEVTDLQPTLKWPNDVLIGESKVCGILAEQVTSPDGLAVVLGCGINVSMDADELPVPTATSLHLHGAEVSMTDLLVSVLEVAAAELDAWQQNPGSVAEAYAAACSTVGRRVRIQVRPDEEIDEPDAFVTGDAIGVDASGCLRVDVDGSVRTFSVGDVVHVR